VLGPKRAVAWRVLDAQYFGVAQRRKRVFVVASARADFDPAAVLFEFDGLRRDTAPSRETGQAIAPCVTNGPPFSRTGNKRVEAEAMVVQKKQWPADIASTLDTTFGTKQGLEDQHVNAGCPLFVPAQTFSIPAIGHIVQDDVASTMTRHTGSGAGETQNPAFVAQPDYQRWVLFMKCMRGDPGDNVFSAYPGVRVKGTKNQVGLTEAFEDRDKKGYAWNNMMLQRWTDHEQAEHKVLDDYERNRVLIDLTAQPQEIKDTVDAVIREQVTHKDVGMVGAHFMKFCGKYDLVKLSDYADSVGRWLNSTYQGVLK
jgi:hypothetical protein